MARNSLNTNSLQEKDTHLPVMTTTLTMRVINMFIKNGIKRYIYLGAKFVKSTHTKGFQTAHGKIHIMKKLGKDFDFFAPK